ncbi:MAG: hypothetical protein OEV01_07250 [Nitrospira sp.]|nr:hypothetical protein [Nitrospira sp.]
MFGKRGLDFHDKIHARAETSVEENHETKSVGEQDSFEQETGNSQCLVGWLNALCQDVMHRVAAEGSTHLRRVALTVRFADCETHSRGHTQPSPA